MVNEADYSSMQLELFDKCEYPPGGYILDSIFSKTSQERFQAMKEWTFAQSLNPLQNVKFQYLEVGNGRTQDWLEADDVMLGGESSMLNILEAPKETSSFPKEGEGYGLSQILEKSTDVPKKYFLSAKACRGIINRSERRNKTLPPILKKALEMQAGITHDEVSIVGGQMYDITHADDVVRETDKSPTLNARMGTGGNQVPILMGDIPSEEKNKAYAIGNGQVHQLYLQDNCGALNCMQDRMKVMQEIDGGGGTDNEDRKVQCLNPQFSQGEKIYHQNGNYPTLRSGSDTGGRGYPNAYVMQEQDVWTSSRAGFWLDFTKNVTNSLVAGGYKGQNIVAVAEKEQDEHID